MQIFISFVFLILLLFQSPLTIATEAIKVTPDFIKMRHSAHVTVELAGSIHDKDLAIIPGGVFISKSKTVSNNAVLSKNLIIDIENKKTIVVYRNQKKTWQEFGRIKLDFPIEKLTLSGNSLIAYHDKNFTHLSLDNIPQLSISRKTQLRHPLRSSTNSKMTCEIASTKISLTAKKSNSIISNDTLPPNTAQIIALKNGCLSIHPTLGLYHWQLVNNKLELADKLMVGRTIHQVSTQGNIIAVANGETGFTLVRINPDSSLTWAGSYNKLGNITHISQQNEVLLTADDRGVLTTFDISNPAAPLLKSDFHSHKTISDISFYNQHAFIKSEHNVFDVDFTTNSSPFISTLGVNQGGSRRSFIENDLLYVADWFSGLHIYDIRQPHHPKLLSSFPTPGSPKGVLVRNGIAYVADDDHGLQIIDVSEPLSPSLVSTLPLSGLAYTMKFSNNLLYIAAHHGGFHIVDIENPGKPKLISTYDTPSKAWALALNNNFLFVADDSSGVLIFDIVNPKEPKLINQFNPGGFAEDIVIRNNKAYLAFFDLGLFVTDISDPENIKQLAHLPTPGNARGIKIVDQTLFLASWEAGVLSIDISDDTNPYLVSQFDTKGAVWGLGVKNEMVYAMDWWGGIKIISFQPNASPQLVSQYQTAGIINDLIYEDRFIYTAHGARGLQIYESSNDLNPVWASGVDLLGSAKALDIQNNFAFIAAGDGGVAMVDIKNPFQPTIVSQIKLPISIDLIKELNGRIYAAKKNGDLFILEYANYTANDYPEKTHSEPTFLRLKKRHPMSVNRIIRREEALYVLDNFQSLILFDDDFMAQERLSLNTNNAQNLIFVDKQTLALQYNNTLTSCKIHNEQLSCDAPITLPANLIGLHTAQNKLFTTGVDGALYVFDVVENGSISLNTIYPSSHRLTHISTSKDGIFFGGENIIASGKLLPPIKIRKENATFAMKIPNNMPKGAYHLAISNTKNERNIYKNALEIGFPKLKSKFTMEQLRAIMKQKQFDGKAPKAQ